MEEGQLSSSSDHQSEMLEGDETMNRKKKGGWRAVKYILANETFEKLASMSLMANITFYLKTKYNMEDVMCTNVVNIWNGSSNFLSIPGALLSDALIGRFCTLLIGSIASLLGMIIMTLASYIRGWTPPQCTHTTTNCIQASHWQLGILFISLTFIAVGSGCIRPCNIAFGADQFNTNTKRGRAQMQRFYSWWYLAFTVALFVAFTGVTYVQTNISWVLGFAIPSGCLVLSVAVFILGRHTYVYNKPQRRIFIDMVKVLVAASRKRNLKVTPHGTIYQSFYDPPRKEIIGIQRTNRLKSLEKAALITDPSELTSEGVPVDNWSLCSLEQVEQLKCVVGLFPIWVTGILCFLAMDQQNTFGILQAIQMDRKLGSKFVMPPAWNGLVSMLALASWILIYEKLVIPLLRRIKTDDNARLSLTERIRIGIFMSIACMLVAGFIEKERKREVVGGAFESNLSVIYLVPQLILSGLIEAFAAVAIMEFFPTQMPESMRSVAGATFFISFAVANYTSSVLVNIIYHTTKDGEGRAWLGGQDLNQNKLEYYYFILAGIATVNLLYFSLFSCKYILIVNHNQDTVLSPLRPISGP